MKTIVSRKLSTALVCTGIAFASMLSLLTTAKAAEMTIANSTGTDAYMALQAKVEYLTALLATLKVGEEVPPPTFAMALSGDVAQVSGTIVRASQSGMMEICGPMTKGTIDWGDGIVEKLYGLGCSGDVFTFERFHQYDVPGSYKITVAGATRTTKTIAPAQARTDTSRMLTLTHDDDAVVAYGTLTLDEALKGSCMDTLVGVIDWGDGSAEPVTSDGCDVSYRFAHTYAMPGAYAVLVRDRDGDAAQEVVVVE
jgi:hypothetical protein